MTSADFSQQALLRISDFLFYVCETSPGKNDNFHSMQPPYLLYRVRVASDFILYGRLIRSNTALYKVSVRRLRTLPTVDFRNSIRLPSDSTSRWTPLPSANASCYRARSGLSPPSYRPCWAHHQKRAEQKLRPFLYSNLTVTVKGKAS